MGFRRSGIVNLSCVIDKIGSIVYAINGVRDYCVNEGEDSFEKIME